MNSAKIISIVIGICCWTPLQGQDFKKDIERINKTYQTASRFQMEMDYNLYVSHDSPKIYESTTALIIRDDQGFYSKMFEQETIVNQEYVILLDHESELFMIDRFEQGQYNESEQGLITNDSLMNLLESMIGEIEPAIQGVQVLPGRYTVTYNFGELEKMELFFDAATYQFRKVILFYRDAMPILENQSAQKPRLEIIYQKFDTNPVIPEHFFSEKKYAQIVPNKTLSPVGRMKDYTVINHLWMNNESLK